nr:reverse transcriptase domain-containing protein [Tanacetum cinerariifolium]
YVDRMPPKRSSTSEASTMSQAAIRKLVADSIAAALETQTAIMAEADNSIREIPVAKRGNYKEFISCQHFYVNGTEGVVGLIRWFDRTESVFSRSNCAEENKVAFATGTLTNDALSWWNAYAQPIGIEQANRITWTELKRLLTNKYYPRTEIKKMEGEFYKLSVKGNDLKTYVIRFQELAVLCPNMIPNNEKLMEVFIGRLPRSIKGNVIASKPQTLEEAINIAQRLMDQVTKHNSIQGTNDHKRKFEDKRNMYSNNNYFNNYLNIRNNRTNDFCQQQNRRPQTFRSYVATPTENRGYTGNRLLCQRCTLHHTGPCTIRCQVCNKVGHLTKNCKNKGPATGSNLQPVSVIYDSCGEKGHYRSQCSKTNINANESTYLLRDKNAHQDPNVVTEELPGLPSVRQIEFQIDLILGAAPVARAPYRLAPSEMQELSNQLQELAYREIEAIKNWASPTTPTEIRQFLGLVGYYRRFIKDFSKIAKSLTIPTQKDKKKELNMRQRRWLELLTHYDCEIRYHPRKANVVADALSQKRIIKSRRVKPLRVRSLIMTIHSKLPSQILEAHTEALKEENVQAENL